jgi:hypothetical protein
MSREEAAAKALREAAFNTWNVDVSVQTALAAAEAHDQANGIHHLTLDDATLERAAVHVPHHPECFWRPSDGNCECKERRLAIARVVLAAAVKEER